jgi:hypothetical protein
MQMLDSRGGADSGDAPPMRQSGGAPRNQSARNNDRGNDRGDSRAEPQYDSSATSDFADIDDDIPF